MKSFVWTRGCVIGNLHLKFFIYFYKYPWNVFSSLLMCRCSICYFFKGWDESCQLWVCCLPSFQESNSHSKWGKFSNYLVFCVIVSWLVPKCGYYQVMCATSINVLAISKWKKFFGAIFLQPIMCKPKRPFVCSFNHMTLFNE